MRFNSIIRAGARATTKANKKPTKPRTKTLKPSTSISATSLENSPLFGIEETEPEANEESNDFTGRVHSESYSAENLTAAFDSLLTNKAQTSSNPIPTTTTNEKDLSKPFSRNDNTPQTEFLNHIQTSTLSTIESYRTSILNSLKLDDQHGRIYSKNVRQMKEILGFEKWRKKLDLLNQIDHQDRSIEKKKKSKPERHPITRVLLPPGSLSVRKALFDRPSLSDQDLTFKVLKDLWKLDKLVDATVVVAYSGELLVQKNPFGISSNDFCFNVS
ncbi:uncharacterized protein MELLADRAFT_79454 [Melampsora larici-populina 98AG31]|uniref:Uncharacterized protein n=1 Tax=Melampsora larici-populina (strain 98AG31 / pathotype 3-4-7) TaxID=747676 RepID=F4S746_MELLP|nr:uncharacterized protein MELLADRAFT_79454 [Melampsora larici-populina 98AG31]EGF99444.1 hypothetical protein MELLADRAFT_79454 [Melampsora larici-populina 98AG31]